MKNKLYVGLGLYIITLSTVCGQNKVKYKFGIIGGVNVSNIVVPSLKYKTDFLYQYNAGISLDQEINSNITLSYQLIYNQTGGRTTDEAGSKTFTHVVKYNYLALPILIRLAPKESNVFVELGGQISYYLSGIDYLKEYQNQAFSNQNVASTDICLVGGLGYRLNNHFTFNARYAHSINKIYVDHIVKDIVTGQKILYKTTPQFNQILSLSVSYYLK